MLDLLLLIEWVTKMKPGSNSVEDHPQMSHNKHPMDGALVAIWPHSEFFPLNMAASLVGGVKFMASPLYFEGIVFGYKMLALVVFKVIMRLEMCDFLQLVHFLFSNFGPYICLLGDYLMINKLKMEELIWYILHNTLQIQQLKSKTFYTIYYPTCNTIPLSTQNKSHQD